MPSYKHELKYPDHGPNANFHGYSHTVRCNDIFKSPSMCNSWYLSFRDALMINCVSFATSIYAGFAVFSIIGYMANEYNRNVADIIDSGVYCDYCPNLNTM